MFAPTREELLYFIWKNQLFLNSDLKTTSGMPIYIDDVGIQNVDSGPDFSNAKINIDNIHWVGNVEFHVKSSDWLKHQHQHDPAYKNVILHVVYEHDIDIPEIPYTLVLKERINHTFIKQYEALMQSNTFIPCSSTFPSLKDLDKVLIWEHLAIQRLERKTREIQDTLQNCRHDWNQTMLIYLFKSFGFKTNAIPFEILANGIPFQVLERYQKDEFKLKALLFGQAGLLGKIEADVMMKKEYEVLAKKHDLKAMDASIFKFFGTRPHNFPTRRLDQLSRLILNLDRNFINTLIYSVKEKEDLVKIFTQAIQSSKLSEQTITTATIELILLNFVVPCKFAYATHHKNDDLRINALHIFEHLKREKNTVVEKFKQVSWIPQNAMDSQAFLELKHEFCDRKRCTECHIGNTILSV